MNDLDVYLRPVTLDDAKLLFEWRNDKTARRNYFNSRLLAYEEHLAWLKRTLNDKKVLFFILEVEGQSVGQIRLTPEEDNLSISYSVDSKQRGKGYGAKLLALIEHKIVFCMGKQDLIGEVKKDNIGSQKVFERLGYVREDKGDYINYKKTIGGR